ncbi:MAG: HAD family hydrolase [Oscillospiraceae bacterium]|nr:HAD family hydrolase [Oscillospiraceae bacterium]
MQPISFTELKRYAKQSTCGYPQMKLAILGDSATQQLAVACKGEGIRRNYDLQVFDADYDQMDALTIDPNSALYAFAPDNILLYFCTQKCLLRYQALSVAEQKNFADLECQRICLLLNRLAAHTNAKVLLCDFPVIDDGVFGNYALRTETSFLYQLRQLNAKLDACIANQYPNVHPIALSAIQVQLGSAAFSDARMWHLAKFAMRNEALPYAAAAILDVISAVQGRIKKCIVLDLDHTLWGGVIGDDGMDGIELGELGAGPAFVALQRWLKALRQRGILLAVCSKNHEEIAKEPFLHHPDMVLRLDDIAMFVANWEDKATNIMRIQNTLNIGMDSIVFLDDNPFERALVAGMLPEITVPDLPEDPALVLDYLQSLHLFEATGFSEEDTNRTAQYQAELHRHAAQTEYADYQDYLVSLKMEAVTAPFESFYFGRIAQLTQRSNQFNLRTQRYTEAEIRAMAESDAYLTQYMTLSDRFGDHGLISVVILKKQENALFIDTWLMSCRVLRRGAEQYLFNQIVALARRSGYDLLIGEYLPTSKNTMVASFYEECGMTPAENGRFILHCTEYQPHSTAISAKDSGK